MGKTKPFGAAYQLFQGALFHFSIIAINIKSAMCAG
jgi:hypothetical protein